jgi:N,N'-diacetyllegionaminate synthase
MKVTLGARPVGDGEPAFVLAEVASAHQGDPAQAFALARAARVAGADGVKFQLFRAAELVAPTDTRFATFSKIELSEADWARVLKKAGELPLAVLADVFDAPSLTLGETHRVAAYKIHSTDMENPDFIRRAASTGKPLLLSTGGLGLGSVERALEAARSEGNSQLIVLHGVQNFPTRIEDAHLRYLATLKATFGFPVGFLDHVDGGSPMARVLPALAVALGADLVEKHLTLDRKARGFDWESSLDPEPFRQMVELVREAERGFGSAVLKLEPSADRYHRLMRRAVLARVPLRKGEPLSPEHIALLRSEDGLAPCDAPRILGRKARGDIPAWTPLVEEFFE